MLNEGVVVFFALDEEELGLGHIHKDGGITDVCPDIYDVYEAHFLGDVAGNLMELHIVSGIELLIKKNRVRKWHSQCVATKF